MSLGEALKRALPSLCWCLLVLGGMAFLTFGPERKPPVTQTSSRALPTNRLVLGSDLTIPSPVGRYVSAPDGLSAGAALKPGDLSDRPAPPRAPPARLLLVVPVTGDSIRAGLNAGSKALLCGKTTVLATTTIESVFCDAGGLGTACSALIAVPNATAADVAAKGFKDTDSVDGLHLVGNGETVCDDQSRLDANQHARPAGDKH